MQVWYKPALTPATYLILNSQRNAIVNPDQSGLQLAVMVGMSSLGL